MGEKGAETLGCVPSQMFLFYLLAVSFIATCCFLFIGLEMLADGKQKRPT